MKKFKVIKGLLVLSAFTILAGSIGCKNKNTPNPNPGTSQTIAQIAQGSGFTILNEALIKTGLETTLAGNGTFTVFAPNDAAFIAAGIPSPSAVDGLSSTALNSLKSVILYHALGSKVLAANIPSGSSSVVSLDSSKNLYTSNNSSGIFVNGIKVITADVLATNGVVHVIGSVLTPPSQSIVSLAVNNDSLSYLVAAVTRASTGQTNVAMLLSDTVGSPFTVFAPTNAAFRAAGLSLSVINALQPDSLTKILATHVLKARIFSSDLTAGAVAATTNLNNTALTISLGSTGDSVSAPGNITPASIGPANIIANNGVIHVVNEVLMPRASIAKIASGLGFTLLQEALKVSGLTSTLSNPAGTFTVFAPTDAAFKAAGYSTTQDIDNIPVATLTSILLYHTLGSVVPSKALTTKADVPVNTLDMLNIYVTKTSAGMVYVNGIPVTTANVAATNGVVHVLGGLLIPPTQTIVELAQGNPNLSTLVSALTKASLVTTLSGKGPFTVFAPTNTAFSNAGINVSTTDKNVLSSVLTLHVIGGLIFSSDLTAGQTPATVNGESLTINLTGGINMGPTVAGPKNTGVAGSATAPANIIQTNILATNGVIHVLDNVLLP